MCALPIFPSWFEVIFDSGISAAAITAILLNLLFNVRRGQQEEAPIFAEAPAIGTTYEGETEGIVVAHTDTAHPTPTRPTRRVPDSHHSPGSTTERDPPVPVP